MSAVNAMMGRRMRCRVNEAAVAFESKLALKKCRACKAGCLLAGPHHTPPLIGSNMMQITVWVSVDSGVREREASAVTGKANEKPPPPERRGWALPQRQIRVPGGFGVTLPA